MNKQVTAIVIALLVATGSLCAERVKPNVIFILTDDQGYGDLSCHGNPILKTPNLDTMHEQSVRFTDFHVSPLCIEPVRAVRYCTRKKERWAIYSRITDM